MKMLRSYYSCYFIVACLIVDLISSFSTSSLLRLNPRRSVKMMGGVPYVPYYPNKASKDYQWMDIYNALGRERTLFVSRYLDEESCNQLIASLIWLQGQSSKDPITLYFNVPGCISKPSMAVFDVMRRMTCPLITINMGLTVGMGTLLCAVGTTGKRYALPNARFLMSKTGLEDGMQGQSVDIGLAVQEVMKDNERFIRELAQLSGRPVDALTQDLKRDFYLTAPEAAAYGIIDKVMMPNQPVKLMRYRGSDDDVVTFGHFCEVRKVKEGADDPLVPYSDKTDAEFDEYAAKQLAAKRGGRPNPKDLKFANRFSNSRCKPPGSNLPTPPTPGGGGKGPDDNKGKFANTGF